MNTPSRKALLSTALLTVAFGFGACSDPKDAVVTKIDCSSVCNRYQDCYNEDFDTDKCKDDCEALAEDNDTKQSQLDDCDDCMDDNSCASSTFNCAGPCGRFIVL